MYSESREFSFERYAEISCHGDTSIREFGSQVILGSVYHCMCTEVHFFFLGKKPIGYQMSLCFRRCLCTGWLYVNLTQARVIREDGASIEQMLLYDPVVGKLVWHFLS